MSYVLSILLSIIIIFIWFFIWGMILRARGEKVKWWFWFYDYHVVFALIGMAFFGFFAVKIFLDSDFFEGNETKKELKEIMEGIATYKANSGEYPKSMNTLIRKSPLRREWKTDEWGNNYEFHISDGKVEVTSGGPDGKLNTADDLTSAYID